MNLTLPKLPLGISDFGKLRETGSNDLYVNEFGSYGWENGTPSMLLKLADPLERPDGDMEGLVLSETDLLFDLADPRKFVLLGAGGFTEKAIHGLWEDAPRYS